MDDDFTATDYAIWKDEILNDALKLMREIRQTPSEQPYYRSRRERCQRDLATIWRIAKEEGWTKRMDLMARAQVNTWMTRVKVKVEAA